MENNVDALPPLARRFCETCTALVQLEKEIDLQEICHTGAVFRDRVTGEVRDSGAATMATDSMQNWLSEQYR
jgi:hypothetical protein